MKLSFVLIPALTLNLALTLGCTDKGNAPGGTAANMMYITGPVGGPGVASVRSVLPMATTGVSLNTETCPSCGTYLNLAHNFGRLFAMQGKLADSNACMIEAVIKNDAVPGITSGEYKYIAIGETELRVKLTMSGKDVSKFSIETCANGNQVQHISGTNTAGDATFKFRSTGGLFAAMDASGEMTGGEWISKTVTAGFYISGSHMHFTMKQEADYMDISGVSDSGVVGTLDGGDLRVVARAQLMGDSAQSYSMGDGSIRYALGSGGSATNTNWNGDTKVEGSGPTTYDSVVASATLPTLPTTPTTSFTTEETWNCQSVTPVNLMQVASSNSGLQKAAVACQEMMQ